jgi:2-polyprenyl-3-methyl-5-hydroxy-6-metoxy-1,4-benzoquinol methylase
MAKTVKSTGIFTPKQAETEHRTSYRLAKKLSEVLPANKDVIDFGCGGGEYLKRLANFRYRVHGYEGQPPKDSPSFVKRQDITKKIEGLPNGSVLCFEVMEHIPKELESAALSNISEACNGRLILSWAVNGQGGCGHVNEQDSHYVIPTIEKLGFKWNKTMTEELRGTAGADLWWFKNSIYVFDR